MHAAGESGRAPPGTRAVCLAVPDEAALRVVAENLQAACIPFVSVVETEGEHAGQLMAIGCAPTNRREVLRRCLSAVPLLR